MLLASFIISNISSILIINQHTHTREVYSFLIIIVIVLRNRERMAEGEWRDIFFKLVLPLDSVVVVVLVVHLRAFISSVRYRFRRRPALDIENHPVKMTSGKPAQRTNKNQKKLENIKTYPYLYYFILPVSTEQGMRTLKFHFHLSPNSSLTKKISKLNFLVLKNFSFFFKFYNKNVF